MDHTASHQRRLKHPFTLIYRPAKFNGNPTLRSESRAARATTGRAMAKAWATYVEPMPPKSTVGARSATAAPSRPTRPPAAVPHQKLAIQAIGLESLSNEVTPDLAREVIESVKVNGILRASHEVRSAIADRIM